MQKGGKRRLKKGKKGENKGMEEQWEEKKRDEKEIKERVLEWIVGKQRICPIVV